MSDTETSVGETSRRGLSGLIHKSATETVEESRFEFGEKRVRVSACVSAAVCVRVRVRPSVCECAYVCVCAVNVCAV